MKLVFLSKHINLKRNGNVYMYILIGLLVLTE